MMTELCTTSVWSVVIRVNEPGSCSHVSNNRVLQPSDKSHDARRPAECTEGSFAWSDKCHNVHLMLCFLRITFSSVARLNTGFPPRAVDIITNVTLLILLCISFLFWSGSLAFAISTDVFHPLFPFYLSEMIYLDSQKGAEVPWVLMLLAFVTPWTLC